MPEQEQADLLNIYEVQEGGRTRHLVGFQDTTLAGERGLASHAMVGEFTPGPDGSFDPTKFANNPEFVAAFVAYMNRRARESDEFATSARQRPGEPLYVIDPRFDPSPSDEPDLADVLGWYDVDAAGSLVPDSFSYNPDHVWFSPDFGPSGVLSDRRFYDDLHSNQPRGGLRIVEHGDGRSDPR
jgi:hypothetical protein